MFYVVLVHSYECTNKILKLLNIQALIIMKTILSFINNNKCLDAQPTLTVLIRGSFGRQAWTLQLRHLPRHRSSSTKQHNVCPGRPVAMEEPGRHRHPRRSTTIFLENIERIRICKMYVLFINIIIILLNCSYL